jgi:gliding motility-associated-like protein
MMFNTFLKSFLIVLLMTANGLIGQTSSKAYYFKYKNEVDVFSISELTKSLQANGLTSFEVIDPFQTNDASLNHVFQIMINNQKDEKLLREASSKVFGYEYLEEVPEHVFFYTPNDYATQQYNLDKIAAKLAWDINKGDTGIIVAVVDDAVDLNHPDLDGNIWSNWGEIPNNGIDDDNNGYIDDVNGWDAADTDNDPNPVALANANYHSHGTHCAGIVSAETNNNTGIASIGFKTKLMPVKIGYEYARFGRRYIGLRNAYRGVDYAIANNADVISMSWGRGAGGARITEQLLFNAANAKGIICVAAAGNSNTNVSSFYPASYNHVISVASCTSSDTRSSFSNYGASIDVTAPGSSIYSTVPGGYATKSGTSMACPLVAGLCALMKAQNPFASVAEIESCLKSSCDNINAANPNFIGLLGAGRINAHKALQCLKPINALFASNFSRVCPGDSIEFSDTSKPTATSWKWSFPGASPNTSTLAKPKVKYNTAGNFSVTLIATNAKGSDTLTKTAYVKVAKPSMKISGGTSIILGSSANIKFEFEGNPIFKVILQHGTIKDTIYSNKSIYYHKVTPTSTTVYKVFSFNDTLCSNVISDSAEIKVLPVPIPGAQKQIYLDSFLHFDGLNDYVQVNNNSKLNFNGDFTIEANIKRDKEGVRGDIFDKKDLKSGGSSTNDVAFVILADNRLLAVFRETSSNELDLYSTTRLNDKKFYHVLVTRKNGICKLYIDGVEEASGSFSNNLTSTGPLWIGSNRFEGLGPNFTNSFPFKGIMNSFTIWDIAKDTSYIKSNAHKRTQGNEAGVVVHYDFNHGVSCGHNPADSILVDRSSNSLDGKLKNFKLTGGCESNWYSETFVKCLVNDTIHKISNAYGNFNTTLPSNSDFGYRSISPGDINNDGYPDLVVSAPTSGGNNKGKVFVLLLDSNQKVKSEVLITENTNGFNTTLYNDEVLGNGLASIGDLNNDGIPDIAIGSRSSDGATHAGAVYICFLDSNGKVKSHQKLSKSAGSLNSALLSAYSNFGISIDTIGDFNNDGVVDLVVGGYTDNTGGNNTGAAWLVYLNANGTAKNTIKLSKNTPVLGPLIQTGSRFGISVSNIGDINKDGVSDIAVASYTDNSGGANRGALFVLKMKSDGTILSVTKNTSSDNLDFIYHNDYYFGIDMHFLPEGTSNEYSELLLGCFNDMTGGSSRGAIVWSYIDSFGNVIDWKKITTDDLPNTYTYENDDLFGSSICLIEKEHNNYSIGIGARGDDDGGSRAGAIYILELSDSCVPLPSPPVVQPVSLCDTSNSEGYQITLGGKENDFANDIDYLKTGEMVVLGYTNSQNVGNQDAYIAMIDSNFRILWQKTFGGSTADKFWSVEVDENDFIYATGYINGKATIYKFHKSGALIWQKKVQSTKVVEFYGIKTFGTKVFLSGVSRLSQTNANSQNVVIYCLDNEGNQIWQKEYDGSRYQSNRDIDVTNSGDVILPTFIFSGSQYDPWLLRINGNNGSVVWAKRFSNSYNDGIATVAILDEHIYVGDHYRPNNNNLQAVVYKLDLDGIVQWGKQIGGSGDERIRSIQPFNDSSIVVSMFKGKASNNSLDGNLFILDSNGNMNFALNVGGPMNDYFNEAISINGGEILAAGYTESFGNGKQDIFITKIPCSLDTICNMAFSNDPISNAPSNLVNSFPTITTPNDLVVDFSVPNKASLNINYTCVKDTCILLPDFDLIPETICLGDTIDAINRTETFRKTAYTWNLGSNYTQQTDSVFTPILSTFAGDLTFTLVANNGCKVDSITKLLAINALPIVDAGQDSTYCLPDTISIGENNFAGVFYKWSPTNGLADSLASPTTAIVTSPITYYLEALDMNTGCSNLDSIKIDEKQGSQIDLGSDTTLCIKDTISIGVPQSGTYAWNTGESTQYIKATQTGEYILSLTEANCTSRDTINIYYDTLVNFTLGQDTSLCEDSSVYLNPIKYASDFDYLWNDNSTDSWKWINTPGTYHLAITNGKCSTQDTILVNVVVMPSFFNLGRDTTLCETDTLEIGFNHTGNYLWNTGASTPTIKPNVSGAYSLTFTRQGCELKDTILIAYDSVPTVNIGSDLVLCSDTSLVLSPNNFARNFQYLWDNGSTDSIRTVSEAGNYRLTITNGKCADSASIIVTEIKTPQPFDLGSDTTFCFGDSLIIGADQGDDLSYLWNRGSQDRYILVEDSGIYRLRIYNDCGAQSDEIKVNYEDCSCTIYVPTAFTPNNDNLNDQFIASYCDVESYKMEVFNRWGEKVYETQNINEGWDGVAKGKKQVGTYYWIMTIESSYINNGKPYIKSGSVQLLR